MTNLMLLRTTAEAMLKDVEDRIENEWHTGTEHQRLIYWRERLKGFKEYVKLAEEY